MGKQSVVLAHKKRVSKGVLISSATIPRNSMASNSSNSAHSFSRVKMQGGHMQGIRVKKTAVTTSENGVV